FKGVTDPEVLQAIIHDPAPSLAQLCPDVPIGLHGVVAKMLEKEPASRYQSVRQLVADLRSLTHESWKASVLPPRRHGASVGSILGAGVFVAVLLATVVYWWTSRTPPAVATRHIEGLTVLPLKNLSGDPAQEFFADGMTEAIYPRSRSDQCVTCDFPYLRHAIQRYEEDAAGDRTSVARGCGCRRIGASLRQPRANHGRGDRSRERTTPLQQNLQVEDCIHLNLAE